MPSTISWEGNTIVLPFAGLSRFLDESMSVQHSAWAAFVSGTWTAIWSPSKSALYAWQTRG